jgi:hypothetical protein
MRPIEDASWRAHSCVPRSHSCERLGSHRHGVRKSANTARQSACATGRLHGLGWASMPMVHSLTEVR